MWRKKAGGSSFRIIFRKTLCKQKYRHITKVPDKNYSNIQYWVRWTVNDGHGDQINNSTSKNLFRLISTVFSIAFLSLFLFYPWLFFTHHSDSRFECNCWTFSIVHQWCCATRWKSSQSGSFLSFFSFVWLFMPLNNQMVELRMNIFSLIRFNCFNDRTWVWTSPQRYIPQENCLINNSNSRFFFPRDCHSRIFAVSLLLWEIDMRSDRLFLCSCIFFSVELTIVIEKDAFSVHTTFFFYIFNITFNIHINENWNEMRQQFMNLARIAKMNWT